MIKNRTSETLKVDLNDSGWATEFKVDEYGMSVRLLNRPGEMKTFIRFQPHDIMAIMEFLEDQTSRWDKEEI